MYSLDIFTCNYYLLFIRHSVLYIRFGEINILYLVSCHVIRKVNIICITVIIICLV